MLYLLDVMINYFTLQFFRCAVFSVVLLAIIMFLRKTVFQRAVFAKGMLWGLLIITPFLGKLEFYYTSKVGWDLFGWWLKICMDSFWISRFYFAGIAVVMTYLITRRIKLNIVVRKMQKCRVGKQSVLLCKEKVTPFVTGTFHPRVVLPECIFGQFTAEETEAIVAHEQTHIRLMHPVIFLLWDIFRAVFWINPLFVVCTRYLKNDMEDICDRVTMRRNGLQSYDYGKLLLHTIRLLQDRQKPDMDIPFAFAGEREFGRMKQRIQEIADFTGYKKTAVCCMGAVAALILVGIFGVIFHNSYANYEENGQINLYDAKGEGIILEDSSEIREVISYDDNYIYIDTDGLCELLKGQEIENGGFWVACGGYQKLPGYGLGGICEYVSTDKLDESRLRIPYEQNYNVLEWIYKVM